MRFSQRLGVKPIATLVQRESLDEALRASLWSVLTAFYWEKATDSRGDMLQPNGLVRYSSIATLMVELWFHHFKEPIDTIDEYWGNCLQKLRTYFFKAEWFQVYDFVEFVANSGPRDVATAVHEVCNTCFEEENSAYRFVNGVLTEIVSQTEIDAVEKAIASSTPYVGVTNHLQSALRLLSNKKDPHFRNSIKESISAVEAIARVLTNDTSATLGAALKELERTKKLHPALKTAFNALYGYTNDAQGIRHALMEEPTLTKADARFMLVCCSSFINYIIDSRHSEPS